MVARVTRLRVLALVLLLTGVGVATQAPVSADPSRADWSRCYYAKTRQAVLDLQRANGIRDSGRLGPKTWRAARRTPTLSVQ